MLTEDLLKSAVKAKRLVVAEPIEAWAPQPRKFLMCPALAHEIEQGRQSSDEKERQRWAVLEASISHFIEGGIVTEDLLKQLQPYKYEHWELRSRKPKPSLRIFGRFALPDVFVGTHIRPREMLGGMWSPEFEHEKLVCEEHWKNAGLDEPFSAPPDFNYEAYITANASKKLEIG
tara:strand:+ start:918 stop:1442 length:525 start_codon:yes stop_codon:yes gene_type:complete